MRERAGGGKASGGSGNDTHAELLLQRHRHPAENILIDICFEVVRAARERTRASVGARAEHYSANVNTAIKAISQRLRRRTSVC